MATDDFFRARLDQMIDLRHPLAVLAKRMPWAKIEAALAPALARKKPLGESGRRTRPVWPVAATGGRWRERGRQAALAYPVDGRAAVSEARLQRER